MTAQPENVPRIAAAYRDAVAGALADRTANALRRGRYKALILGGGVSLNARIREKIAAVAAGAGVLLAAPEPKYCGDNAAMIAGLAFWRRNVAGDDALGADVHPDLEAGETPVRRQ